MQLKGMAPLEDHGKKYVTGFFLSTWKLLTSPCAFTDMQNTLVSLS